MERYRSVESLEITSFSKLIVTDPKNEYVRIKVVYILPYTIKALVDWFT